MWNICHSDHQNKVWKTSWWKFGYDEFSPSTPGWLAVGKFKKEDMVCVYRGEERSWKYISG
jgi:hypothetical protein